MQSFIVALPIKLGKFFIFDGKRKCYVLSDQKYDDVVGVVHVDESFKQTMFELDKRISVSPKKLRNIIETLNAKYYQQILASFTLYADLIQFIKETSQSKTHIGFKTQKKNIVFYAFDYRELVEGESNITYTNVGQTTKFQFNKIININSFNKFCSQNDYIVNVGSSDIIEFQAIENSYSLLFQEQFTLT